MDISSPDKVPAPDQSHPLTKEELHVHDQLESLDFSPAKEEKKEDMSISPAGETDGFQPNGLSDLDDSDSDEELNLGRPRRVTRQVTRYGATRRKRNPFGPSIDPAKNSSALDRELRLVSQQRKKRQQNEKMLEEIKEGRVKIGKDESQYAYMAREVQKMEERRLQSLQKYSAPVPLFVLSIAHPDNPTQNSKHGVGYERFLTHILHDIILELTRESSGVEGNEAVDTTLIPNVKKYMDVTDASGFLFMVGSIYWLLVYDDTDSKTGRAQRSGLLGPLLEVLQKFASSRRLNNQVKGIPPLIVVLRNYGAVFGPDVKAVTSCKWESDCLDGEMPYMDNIRKTADGFPASNRFQRAIRNLGRACTISVEMIRLGLPIAYAIDETKAGLAVPDMVLYTLGVCVRVIMSAFGCRLSREIGHVIEAAIDTVPGSDWRTFRLTAAQYILSITPRLEQHLDLITFLLPGSTPRLRYLLMDVGFVSLNQWCAGPALNPFPRSLEKGITPSEDAIREGLETISYTVNDILPLTCNLTELGKDVDMDWAEFMAGIIKMIVGDEFILLRTRPDDLRKLYNTLSVMRANTRRIVLDVPVQRMRISLDATLKIIDDRISVLQQLTSRVTMPG